MLRRIILSLYFSYLVFLLFKIKGDESEIVTPKFFVITYIAGWMFYNTYSLVLIGMLQDQEVLIPLK